MDGQPDLASDESYAQLTQRTLSALLRRGL